jgi:hypothetical protein
MKFLIELSSIRSNAMLFKAGRKLLNQLSDTLQTSSERRNRFHVYMERLPIFGAASETVKTVAELQRAGCDPRLKPGEE